MSSQIGMHRHVPLQSDDRSSKTTNPQRGWPLVVKAQRRAGLYAAWVAGRKRPVPPPTPWPRQPSSAPALHRRVPPNDQLARSSHHDIRASAPLRHAPKTASSGTLHGPLSESWSAPVRSADVHVYLGLGGLSPKT